MIPVWVTWKVVAAVIACATPVVATGILILERRLEAKRMRAAFDRWQALATAHAAGAAENARVASHLNEVKEQLITGWDELVTEIEALEAGCPNCKRYSLSTREPERRVWS